MVVAPAQTKLRMIVTGGNPDAPYPVPTEAQLVDRAGEAAPFIDAPHLGRIAGLLMEKYPAKFSHLASLTIEYIWKADGGQAGGLATFGKCVKPSGLLRHFSEADWVIWLGADHCAAARFTAYQVEALLFHEMLHAGVSGKGNPTVWPHEFQGFVAELEEYGVWNRDLVRPGKAFQQLDLFETIAD